MGWDDNGLPTERRVQNLLRRPLRPVAALRPLDFRRARQARLTSRCSISRRNFVELCEQLTAVDEQAFEEVWRRLGLSVDWRHYYTTIDERSRRTSQVGFLRNLAPGRGLPAGGARPSGTWTTARPSPRPRWRTARPRRLPPARLPPDRRRAATSSSTPPGPSWWRPAWPWSPTPATTRYQPLFGTTAYHAAVRRRGADRGPPPGRPREGHRHGHDLHLRRRHRRHLVARAPAADPGRDRPRRPPGRRPCPTGSPPTPAAPPTASWPAGR